LRAARPPRREATSLPCKSPRTRRSVAREATASASLPAIDADDLADQSERLGHDVATLLKTYAHVIRSDDDRVRAIVDETLADSAEDFLRTNAR